MSREVAQLEAAIRELAIDGESSDEEIWNALVARFGRLGLEFRLRLQQHERDETAQREEFMVHASEAEEAQ